VARTVPERWVNAVITFTVPMDVSPDAPLSERRDVVVDLFEDRFSDLGDDCVAEMHPRTVEG
jgi:hypothetical protein